MASIIAVSACLLGVCCRYDGGSKPNQEVIDCLKSHDCGVVRICPRGYGRAFYSHDPHEIDSKSATLKVIDCCGEDHTESFVKGAEACLREFKKNAVLMQF